MTDTLSTESGIVPETGILEVIAPLLDVAQGVIATFTDEAWGGNLDEFLCTIHNANRLAHLMEFRVFGGCAELHAVRGHTGAAFVWRVREDEPYVECKDLWFDEIQYLDINTQFKHPDSCTYRSTTGGVYHLPIADADRIMIRNYLAYDAHGMASVVDFRIVQILARGEHDGC